MEHSSYQTRCLQFPDFFRDELLSFQSLLPGLLLDGPRMRTDIKVVLNHLPGNAGDVGSLPCKHIDIRPQEGDERDFLFVVKGGAYGKSSSRAVLLDRNLLDSRRCGPGLLVFVGGALWHVLDGSATLRRGTLAGVGARGLTDLLLLPSRGSSGRSMRLSSGGCCNCLLVELVSAN